MTTTEHDAEIESLVGARVILRAELVRIDPDRPAKLEAAIRIADLCMTNRLHEIAAANASKEEKDQ